MRKLFRVIVAGSRTATSEATYTLLARRLDHLLSARKDSHEIVIISGTANGADKLGERYAAERNYKLLRYPADWDTHGKKAGYLRNVQMAQNADALVALWDGKSRGTQHMIDIAKDRNLPTRVINFETYEVSSRGDRRFSAFFATLQDGRTIETAYQTAKGTGKGRPATDPTFDYWGTYKALWDQWATENPALIKELATITQTKTLTDQFARTENNQARALTQIIRERFPMTTSS